MLRIINVLLVSAFFSFSLVFAQSKDENQNNPFSTEAMSSAVMLDKGYKRYQVESGIIYYELGGSEKGTLVIYFDRWGLREAQYKVSEMRILGIKQKTRSVTYLDGENQYAYKPEDNTYFRIKNTLIKPVTEDMGNGDMTVGGKELYKGMGGEMLGHETFMGENCEIWALKSLNIRQLIWNGISLKLEGKVLGIKTEQIATQIQIGVDVPENKVALPANAISSTAAYGY